jgi:hypothetical protein
MQEQPNNINNSANDEISLKELIQKIGEWGAYLKTQWIKIALVGFIGGCIGFVYAWMQPVTYTAKLTFVVEEGKSSGSSLGGLASLAGQFGVDMGGSGGGLLSGDNVMLYFKSNTLIKEALISQYDSTSSLSIADVYANVYRLKDSWEKNENVGKIFFYPRIIKPVKYSRLQDSLLQKMIEGILKNQFSIVKTDKKASFLEVSTTMIDEELSKKFCEKVVNVAVEEIINTKTQRQKNIVEKLQFRADSLSNLLGKKTASSAALLTSSSTMDINPLYKTGTSVAVETNMRDKGMLATIFASVIQNLELAKFTLSQETPVIQVVDAPQLPLQKNKISRLKSALQYSIFSVILFLFFIGVKQLYISIIKK